MALRLGELEALAPSDRLRRDLLRDPAPASRSPRRGTPPLAAHELDGDTGSAADVEDHAPGPEHAAKLAPDDSIARLVPVMALHPWREGARILLVGKVDGFVVTAAECRRGARPAQPERAPDPARPATRSDGGSGSRRGFFSGAGQRLRDARRSVATRSAPCFTAPVSRPVASTALRDPREDRAPLASESVELSAGAARFSAARKRGAFVVAMVLILLVGAARRYNLARSARRPGHRRRRASILEDGGLDRARSHDLRRREEARAGVACRDIRCSWPPPPRRSWPPRATWLRSRSRCRVDAWLRRLTR